MTSRLLTVLLLAASTAWGAGPASSLRFDFDPSHMNPMRGRASGIVAFTIERAAVAPVIDGADDDAAWRKAAVLDDFAIPEPATTARFCYDDRNLYILMWLQDAPGKPAFATKRNRDSNIRNEDIVYFAINPRPGSDDECLIKVSAAGAVADSRRGDDKWNPAHTIAVKVEDKGWRVEAAIPLAELGLDKPPARLGFNIGRAGPAVMIRSWFNALHYSTAASCLELKGAGPAEAEAAEAVVSSPNVTVLGDTLSIDLPRAFARPQDRWLDATLVLKPKASLDQARLKASLFALGGREPVETAEIVPTAKEARLSVDLRRPGLAAAEVTIELLEGKERTALGRLFLTAQPLPALSPDRRIEIAIDAPPAAKGLAAWPVNFGVPFPAGALWDTANLRLVDRQGREIPCQKEATGLWAREGAIQWVRFDAVVNPAGGCFVETKASSAAPQRPVAVTPDKDGKLWLDTGAARYRLAKGASPVEEIWLGDRLAASSAGVRGLYVIDQQGRTAAASAQDETMTVEAAGPIAASVRLEGFYRAGNGEPLARHITRVEASAGQPFARVTHTLVITNDTNKQWFKEVGWELAVAPGDGPKAVFNTSRADASKTVSQLLSGAAPAFMIQDQHRRFGAGKDHFAVQAGATTLEEGEECGDWALLAGAQGGLAVACREAARQHPKEFEVFANRIVLKLFSSRAGEELDFRSPALAKKWNLNGEVAEETAKVVTNAAGWSKTHELLLAPVAAASAEKDAALLSALHQDPVYALADPAWLHDTRAMGPMWPRDTQRFPEVEASIDRLLKALLPRGHETGHYGFMDYFAGPTYSGGPGLCGAGRYRFTYGFRSSIWMVYARSGSRAARQYAEGTNKAFLDNYIAHWDAPGKTRGVLTGSGERFVSQLPFYWGQSRSFNYSSSTNLNQFLWLHHIAGYRRAKDAVVQYGEGLASAWNPQMRDWRVLMVLRVLTQCYGFTWDPRLRALAEGTFDSFVDWDSEVFLTKNRPYNSSTYKTQVDVRSLIELWQLLGDPKHRKVATRVARFWWNDAIATLPVSYMNPLGYVGSFLYEETGEPAIAAGLDFGVRRAASDTASIGASAIASIFESLPLAMSVLARNTQPLPWVAYRDYGYPSSVVALKARDGSLDFTVRSTHKELGRQFELRPVGITDTWGRDVWSVLQRSAGAGAARVPKDSPAGAYEIEFGGAGEHFALLSAPAPMVLHAPKYWAPPELAPAARVHFDLPKDSKNAQIFFEGLARLFDPDGKPFGAPEGQRGWVDLPAEKPGLWSFEPLQNRLVRVRNLPPFFAFGGPASYFAPPIEWESEEAPPPPAKIDKDTLYVAGAIEGLENKALFLSGRKTFNLDAGQAHASGDGAQCVPHRAGTVEFFFQPAWDTFDLGAGAVKKSFARILTTKSPWFLMYRVDPDGVNENLAPRDPSHSFYGSMDLESKGKAHLRVWRTQTIFERGQWVHVAWSWGPEVVSGPHREKLNLMTMRVFVNGRGVKQTIFRSNVDALAAGQPKSLVIDPLDGAIDELRVSSGQRYTSNFTPPRRDRELPLDDQTRALFHFNGNLEGQSAGAASPVIGIVK